ncbi:MAG: VOC family protein, partial [Burkholderiaceae bacterium]
MFDHVKFGVSDYAASKAFYLKALEPLGVAVVSEGPPTYGVELCTKGKASLCLFQTKEKPAHLHLAFTAENR